MITADKVSLEGIAALADKVEDVGNRLQQLWFDATAGRLTREDAAKAVAVQLARLEAITKEAQS